MVKAENNEDTRIKQLEKCLKEKDKRIKKIEEYFWLRNHLIFSILATLFCFSPVILLLLFGEPVPIGYETPLLLLIFSIIGIAAFVIGLICSWGWLMGKIWGDIYS